MKKYTKKERSAIHWARYYSKNKEELAMKRKKWYHNNEEKAERQRLMSRYGITLEQKYEMLEEQNNKCAICQKELDMGRCTQIDHDHKTGKVRGVLCNKCNSNTWIL